MKESNNNGEDYFYLIDEMICEVKELELEIVALRYLLSMWMSPDYREDMRSDIYSVQHHILQMMAFILTMYIW